MNDRINIMDVPIDVVTMDEVVLKLLEFLKSEQSHAVFTPNPEIIMEAQNNKDLMQALKRASLVVPDGIGVVLASKILEGPRLPERVAGYDLVQNLFKSAAQTDYTFYFLGGQEGVAQKAAERMAEQYKGLKIVGSQHGYFKDEKEIIKKIQDVKPDVLLVGLGAPKQEIFIDKYKDILPCKLCIGVGGSFDVMAGKVKRAPVIFQKLGLEWFYRLISQPSRIKRMIRLPIFMWNIVRISAYNKKK
ncbi:MAG TPA: WecB/TagA/CpsF family glycosyltransferase [Defluviitaleaceae bacterium]|nr:WecB/TagA/CpsF family glycosyltransferase [Defluviitaleaceae bacterium]